MRFAYKARNRHGQAVSGVVQAASEAAAARELRSDGLVVTSIKEVKEPVSLFQRRVNLKAKHLALFCRQFAIMLGTGVTLVKALELLEEQAVDPAFAKVLQTVRLDVASGTAFTKAF